MTPILAFPPGVSRVGAVRQRERRQACVSKAAKVCTKVSISSRISSGCHDRQPGGVPVVRHATRSPAARSARARQRHHTRRRTNPHQCTP
jgi:hypothetical protein